LPEWSFFAPSTASFLCTVNGQLRIPAKSPDSPREQGKKQGIFFDYSRNVRILPIIGKFRFGSREFAGNFWKCRDLLANRQFSAIPTANPTMSREFAGNSSAT
jgi:hypothetical protein